MQKTNTVPQSMKLSLCRLAYKERVRVAICVADVRRELPFKSDSQAKLQEHVHVTFKMLLPVYGVAEGSNRKATV